MERGLLWLPLLIFFISLAWIGAREYQKVEAYQRWAQQFDQAKYDIYAILGQKGRWITWGQPFQKDPQGLQTFSLDEVVAIDLKINGQKIDLENLPTKGKPYLVFDFTPEKSKVEIPFTEIPLAVKWLNYLRGLLKSS